MSLLNVDKTFDPPEVTFSLICLKLIDGAGTLDPNVSAALEARLSVEGLEYLGVGTLALELY